MAICPLRCSVLGFSDAVTVIEALLLPVEGDTVHQLGAVMDQFVLLVMLNVCEPPVFSKSNELLLQIKSILLGYLDYLAYPIPIE